MPELPEVETIAHDLNKLLEGRIVSTVETLSLHVFSCISTDAFNQGVLGQEICFVDRLGKMLRIKLSNDKFILVHLRMTGSLVYNPPGSQLRPSKHRHVVFCFSDDSTLSFVDVRKFGRIYLVPGSELAVFPYLKRLGPDPLSMDSSQFAWRQSLRRATKVSIKSFLLDQHKIAGIGNIYASEILFESRLNPFRSAASLTDSDVDRLLAAIKSVLVAAISARGTTFSDYRDAQGEMGTYQHCLQVYGAENRRCNICNAFIKKSKQNGRSTYYCDHCQQ